MIQGYYILTFLALTLVPLARRNVSLRRVKSKVPALQQEQTE